MKKKIVGLLWGWLSISCTANLIVENPEKFSLIGLQETYSTEETNEEPQNIAPIIVKTNPPNGEIISGNSDAYLKWDFFDEDGPIKVADLLQSLSFLVEIDTDESFGSPRIFNLEGKNDIWVSTSPNTTYYWRVRVSDGIDETEDSTPFMFEIIPN
jgi:hypothetical protein